MSQNFKFDFIVNIACCCCKASLTFAMLHGMGLRCHAQNAGWLPPAASSTAQPSSFEPNTSFQPPTRFQAMDGAEPRRDANTVNASFPEPGEFRFSSGSSNAASRVTVQATSQAVHTEPARFDRSDLLDARTPGPASSSLGRSVGGIMEFVSQQSGKLFGSDSTARTSGGPDWRRMIGGLALVLGGYFLLVSFVRWINPKRNGPLPTEVVEVLGKTPFGNRQNLQLVRLGSKLLLLLESSEGIQPIAEIEDPNEVQQVIGMCCQPPSRRRRSATSGLPDHSNHVAIPALLNTERPARTSSDDTNQVSLTDLARAIDTVSRSNPKRRTYFEA